MEDGTGRNFFIDHDREVTTFEDPRLALRMEEKLRSRIRLENEKSKSNAQRKVDAKALQSAKKARSLKRLEADVPQDWICKEDVGEGVILMCVDLMCAHLPMELGPETGKLGALLLAINNEPVDAASFNVITHRIRCSGRPLTLTFSTDVDAGHIERALRAHLDPENDYDQEWLPVLRRKRFYRLLPYMDA